VSAVAPCRRGALTAAKRSRQLWLCRQNLRPLWPAVSAEHRASNKTGPPTERPRFRPSASPDFRHDPYLTPIVIRSHQLRSRIRKRPIVANGIPGARPTPSQLRTVGILLSPAYDSNRQRHRRQNPSYFAAKKKPRQEHRRGFRRSSQTGAVTQLAGRSTQLQRRKWNGGW
jgi:hypothetical protein